MRWSLLLLILLLPVVCATPQSAQSLVIDGSIISPVEITKTSSAGDIEYVTANISWYPVDGPSQAILFIDYFPSAKEANSQLVFRVDDPSFGHHDFGVEYQVRTTADVTPVLKKIAFPLTSISSSFSNYLVTTDTIDITSEISSLASEIVAGVDDEFLAVAKLALWTREHIEYDLSTIAAEASQPSSWVLDNREGVCDEMTNLFISFLRSVGIPARFVSGLAYTDSELFDENWGAHGWAEVYFPEVGWVPFDVAYGQFGWVDASHIVFARGVDSGKYTSSFSWLGRGAKISPEGMTLSASIVESYGELDSLVNLEVEPLEERVGFGSHQVAIVTIENPTSHYLVETVYFVSAEDATLFDGPSQDVILPPFSEETLYWHIAVPKNLDAGYFYTYPLLVQTSRGASVEGSFSVSHNQRSLSASWVESFIEGLSSDTKNFDDDVEFSCRLEGVYSPKPDELFTVSCSLKNTGEASLDGVDVCLFFDDEDDCQTIKVLPSATRTVSFTKMISSPSLHALSFSASNEYFERFAYVSVDVVSEPVVVIANVSTPQSLAFSEMGAISFEVSSPSGPSPRLVTVSLSGPRINHEWEFNALTEKKIFDISLSGDVLSNKDNVYTIKVTYVDQRGNSYEESTVFTLSPSQSNSWWENFLLWLSELIDI